MQNECIFQRCHYWNPGNKLVSEVGLIVFGKTMDGVGIQETVSIGGKPQLLTCSHRRLL